MWYWSQSYRRHLLSHMKIWVNVGKLYQVDTCGKTGPCDKQCHWKNQVIEFSLLSTTPIHTFPHITYFTLTHHMLPVSKCVLFGGPRFTSCPTCGKACQGMALWKCVPIVYYKDTHCHTKNYRNFTTLHTLPQLFTVSHRISSMVLEFVPPKFL